MRILRNPLLVVLSLTFVLFSCDDAFDVENASEEERVDYARNLHDRAITIDTHDDIPSNFATDEVDPGEWGERKVTIPKMVEGGLDAGFFIVFVGQAERTPENYEKTKADAMIKFEAVAAEMQEAEMATL